MPREELSRGSNQLKPKPFQGVSKVRGDVRDFDALTEVEKTQLSYIIERLEFPEHPLTERLKTFVRRYYPEIT